MGSSKLQGTGGRAGSESKRLGHRVEGFERFRLLGFSIYVFMITFSIIPKMFKVEDPLLVASQRESVEPVYIQIDCNTHTYIYLVYIVNVI